MSVTIPEICSTQCGLYESCKRKTGLAPTIDCRLSSADKNTILVVGDYTDHKDDPFGYFNSDDRGYRNFIKPILEALDCNYVFTTALACPVNDKETSIQKKHYRACFEVKLKPLILKYKPKAIICLGKAAMDAVLQDRAPKSLKTITQTGMSVEFYEEEHHEEVLNSLVIGLNHPIAFKHPKTDVDKLELLYRQVFTKAEDFCLNAEKRLPVLYDLIETPSQFAQFIQKVPKKFAFDIENTYAEKDIYKNTIWKVNTKIISLSVTYRDSKGDYKSGVIVGEAVKDKALIQRLFYKRHVVAHNCLVADSKVHLADGTVMTLGSMVKNKHEGPVLTVNEKTGEIEAKKVIGWIKGPRKEWSEWLRVNCRGRGFLSLTKDHEVLTSRGRVKAEDLTVGDKVISNKKDFTSAQKALIIGSWLGDASFQLSNRSISYRFSVSHSKEQEEYVDFKQSVLGSFVKKKEKASSNRGFSSNTVMLNLMSASDPRLNDLVAQAPTRNKTTLTENNLSWLEDPRVLAVWYCDDGSAVGDKGYRAQICTSAYGAEKTEQLQNKLNELGFEFQTYARPDGHIYLTSTSKLFWHKISPYFPSCMSHKLPKFYRNNPDESLWVSREVTSNWTNEIINITPLLKTETGSRYSGRSKSSERGCGPVQYCLEVEDNHNFFVSGLSVSNCKHDVQGIYRLCGVDIWPLVDDYEDTMAKFYLADQNRQQNDLKSLSAKYLEVYDYQDDVKRHVVEANNRIAALRKQLIANAREKLKHANWYDEALLWQRGEVNPETGKPFSSAKIKNLKMVLGLYSSKEELLELLKVIQDEVQMMPAEGTADYGDIPISILGAYNAEDTVCTLRLEEEILPYLSKYDPSFGRQDPLWSATAYTLYKRSVRMASYVERNGLPIDIDSLNKMGKDLEEKELEVRKNLLNYPEVIEALESLPHIKAKKEKGTLTDEILVNEISPTKAKFMTTLCKNLKLGRFAAETKSGGFSFTGKEVVKKIAGFYENKGATDLARLFKDFIYIGNNRQVRSKFIKNWNQYYVPEDKCFHPIFKLTKNQSTLYANKDASGEGGAGSGRLAAAMINSQQIRKVRYLRKHFKARKGYKFAEFDYCQLEVYVIAWLSGCEQLKETFRRGLDIYRVTANEIFLAGTAKYVDTSDPDTEKINKLLKAAVSTEMRNKMKVGFLAWAYGRSKPSFARDLSLTEEETDEFYEKAEKKWHEIFTWKKEIIQDIIDGNPITTPWGRFRTAPIAPPEPNNWHDKKRYDIELKKLIRSIVNFPPQATGSDICLWMASNINEWIQREGLQDVIRIVNLVHDAIWFEIKETQLEWAAEKITQMMEDVSSLPFNFDIPLRTEWEYGDTMADYIKNDEEELAYV